MRNKTIKQVTSIFLAFALMMSNTGNLYLAESQGVEPEDSVVQAQYIVGDMQDTWSDDQNTGVQEADDAGNVQAQYITAENTNQNAQDWYQNSASNEYVDNTQNETEVQTTSYLYTENGDSAVTVRHKDGSPFNASWHLETKNVWQILDGLSEDEIRESLDGLRYEALTSYMKDKKISISDLTQEDINNYVKMIDLEYLSITDSSGNEINEKGLVISINKSPSKELHSMMEEGFEIIPYEYQDNHMLLLSKEDQVSYFTKEGGLYSEISTDSKKLCIAVIDGNALKEAGIAEDISKEETSEESPETELPSNVDEEIVQEYLEELEREENESLESETEDPVIQEYLEELEKEENETEIQAAEETTEIGTEVISEDIEESEIAEAETEIKKETTEAGTEINLENSSEVSLEEEWELEDGVEYSGESLMEHSVEEESEIPEETESEEATEESLETELETEVTEAKVETEENTEVETEVETESLETEIESEALEEETELDTEAETESETEGEVETEEESETETEEETEEETEVSGFLVATATAGNVTVSAYSDDEEIEGSIDTRAAEDAEVSEILSAYLTEQNIPQDLESNEQIIQYANVFNYNATGQVEEIRFMADAMDAEEALKVIDGSYAWRIAVKGENGWQFIQADGMNPEAKEDGSMRMKFHVPANEFAIIKMDLSKVGAVEVNAEEETEAVEDENPLTAEGLKVFVYDDDHSETTLTVPEGGIEEGSSVTAHIKPAEGYRVSYVYIAEVKDELAVIMGDIYSTDDLGEAIGYDSFEMKDDGSVDTTFTVGKKSAVVVVNTEEISQSGGMRKLKSIDVKKISFSGSGAVNFYPTKFVNTPERVGTVRKKMTVTLKDGRTLKITGYCLQSSLGTPATGNKSIEEMDHNNNENYRMVAKALYLLSEESPLYGHTILGTDGNAYNLKKMYTDEGMTVAEQFAMTHAILSKLYWIASGKPGGWTWNSGTNASRMIDYHNCFNSKGKAFIDNVIAVLRKMPDPDCTLSPTSFTADQAKTIWSADSYRSPVFTWNSYSFNTLSLSGLPSGVTVHDSTTGAKLNPASIPGGTSFYFQKPFSVADTNLNVTGSAAIYSNSGAYRAKSSGSVQDLGLFVADNTKTFTIKGKWPDAGKLTVKKAAGGTTNQAYSLAGATFEVHVGNSTSAGTLVATLTTDANGNAGSVSLPPGSYLVIEKSAPTSGAFTLNSTGVLATLTASGKTVAITDNYKTGSIIVRKTGAGTGASAYSVKGAVYTVSRSDGSYYGRITIGENGQGTLTGVPLGTYKIKESAGPSCGMFDLDGTTYTVNVTPTALTATVNSTDTIRAIPVKLKKTASGTSNKTYSMAGAKFTIYDSNNKSKGVVTIGSNNESNTITLPFGTYKAVETTLPTSGAFGKAPDTTFRVTAGGTQFVVNIAEPYLKGSINLTKKFVNGYSPEGAEYTIYNASNIPVGVMRINAVGRGSFSNLPIGVYTVKETKVPTCGIYALDTRTYTANIGPTSDGRGGFSINLTSEEPLASKQIKVRKNKGDPRTAGAVYKGTYNGQTYTFTIGSDGVSNTVTIPYAYTDSTKTAIAETMTVQETQLPTMEGYVLNNRVYTVNILENTGIIEVKNFRIDDELFSATISKKSLNESFIPGATLELVYEDGTVSDTWVSTTEPHTTANNLLPGVYTVREVEAPAGYWMGEPRKFEIDDEGVITDLDTGATNVTEFKVYNAPSKAVLSKFGIDESNTTAALAGAVFEIKDSEGTVVWTNASSASNTSWQINGILTDGKTYTLEEVTAPSGYKKIDPITFTAGEVLRNNTINISYQNGSNTSSFVSKGDMAINVYDTTLNINVGKYGITNGNEQRLSGASMQLLTETGTVVTSWTTGAADTPVRVPTAGTYIIHEAAAPSGYIVADDITVVIDEYGNFTVDGKKKASVKVVDESDQEYGRIIINKQASDGTIDNVTFELTDSNGKLVDTITFDPTQGAYTTKVLKVGPTYTLTETDVTTGYALAAPIKFKVLAGQVVSILDQNRTDLQASGQTLTVTDNKPEISVSKKNIDEEFVSGAVLQLLGNEDAVLDEWTTTNSAYQIPASVLSTLDANTTYKIHEKTAPSGYETAADIPFTIGSQSEISIEMEDEYDDSMPLKVTVKKTANAGDYTSIFNGLADTYKTFRFKITGTADNGTQIDQTVTAPVTAASGTEYTVEIPNIPKGTYTITELTNPYGSYGELWETSYSIGSKTDGFENAFEKTADKESDEFTVVDKSTVVSFVNDLTVGAGIRLEKTRSDNLPKSAATQDAFNGAEFAVYELNNSITVNDLPLNGDNIADAVAFRSENPETATSKIIYIYDEAAQTLDMFTTDNPSSGGVYTKVANLVPGSNIGEYYLGGSGDNRSNFTLNPTDTNGGWFAVKETVAPVMSEINPNAQVFNIIPYISSSSVPTVRAQLTIEDEPKKANILLKKVDSVNNTPLLGATFGLYEKYGNGDETAITNPETQIAYNGELYNRIGSLGDAGDGTYGYASDLVHTQANEGHFLIKEESAPNGYSLYTKGFSLIADGNGTEIPDETGFFAFNICTNSTDGINPGTGYTEFTLKNRPITLKVLKVDENGDPLAGANLRLQKQPEAEQEP